MALSVDLQGARFTLQLSEPHRRALAALASVREYPEDTALFEEEKNSPYVYCVLEGKVSLQIREPFGEVVEVDTVGPGELLGWSPLFGRRGMTASARTATACRLAVFEVSRVAQLCERDPQFGFAFLRQVGHQVSDRLRSTRRALALARTLSHHSPYSLRHGDSD
jgi:CRP-like cAMP-binding protein